MPEPRTTTEYRVVTRDGDVTSSGLDDLPTVVGWRDEDDERYPHEAPHRVQSRAVTVGEWQDVQTEEAKP